MIKYGQPEWAQLSFVPTLLQNDPEKWVMIKGSTQGTRSCIVMLFDRDEYTRQREGVVIDNKKQYPKAHPKQVLRILRNGAEKTDHLQPMLDDYHFLVENFVGDGEDQLAQSNELIVELNDKDISLLCQRTEILSPPDHKHFLVGLQQYIHGDTLDPWRQIAISKLKECAKVSPVNLGVHLRLDADGISKLESSFRLMRTRIHTCLREHKKIPDLGIGNTIMEPSGSLTIIDINNLIRAPENLAEIPTDENGYPAFHGSIDSLLQIDRILGDTEGKEVEQEWFDAKTRHQYEVILRQIADSEGDQIYTGAN